MLGPLGSDTPWELLGICKHNKRVIKELYNKLIPKIPISLRPLTLHKQICEFLYLSQKIFGHFFQLLIEYLLRQEKSKHSLPFSQIALYPSAFCLLLPNDGTHTQALPKRSPEWYSDSLFLQVRAESLVHTFSFTDSQLCALCLQSAFKWQNQTKICKAWCVYRQWWVNIWTLCAGSIDSERRFS